MRRLILAVLALFILVLDSFAAPAANTPLSQGTLRALAKSRSEALKQLSQPVTVAGVRGARVEAEELYWKGGSLSADKLIQQAETLETEEKHEDALKVYTKIMIEGASGRVLERASIGWAVCRFRMGDAASAIRRLRDLCSRSSDRDIQFSASIPLALALHSKGDAKEAMDLLKKLIARHPDHPLAGQAEGMILLLSAD